MRKKQSIKTESSTLDGQIKQHARRRKRAETGLGFSLCFFFFFVVVVVVVLTYLFAGIVSTAERLARDPFSEFNSKWGAATFDYFCPG